MALQPRIAIVDDEEPVRRALSRMLGTSLFAVETFSCGQDFLDSLLTRCPDCVLLDFHMPGLTGRDVQQRLRGGGVDVPVIVMTAHDQAALHQQCMAEGAFAYLSKPLRRDPLIKMLEAATGGGVGARAVAGEA